MFKFIYKTVTNPIIGPVVVSSLPDFRKSTTNTHNKL